MAVKIEDDGHYERTLEEGMWERLDENPNLMHITGHVTRPFAMLFSRMLELHHYKPGTTANDDYSVMAFKWGPMEWFLLSVPVRDIEKVLSVAEASKVKLVKGRPLMIGGQEGVQEFPLKNERVYSIENLPGCRCYQDPEWANREEERIVKEMESIHNEWLDQQDEFWEEGRWWYRARGRQDPILNTAIQAFSRLDSHGREVIWYATKSPRDDAAVAERK